MLKKGRQKKQFNRMWKSMRGHLHAFYESQDSKELHKTRIQIKKINALLVCLQDSSKKGKLLKHFRPIRPVFKHAGEIRSVHVNLDLIKRYQLANVEFRKGQDELLAVKTRRFYSKRDAYMKRISKVHKILPGNFHDIKNKSIAGIYKKRLKKLAGFFAEHSNNAGKLHKCRKRIKVILYFHPLLPKPLKRKLQLNKSYLDQLQDTIGKWHDAISAASLLKIKGHTDQQGIYKLQTQSRKILRSINTLSTDFRRKISSRS